MPDCATTEWKVVGKNRKRKPTSARSSPQSTSVRCLPSEFDNKHLSSDLMLPDIDQFSRKLHLFQTENVAKSSLMSFLAKKLAHLCRSSDIRVVCYGLGHFANCNKALHQLALLLELRNQFPDWLFSQVYDPIFSQFERQWLGDNGFTVPKNNSRLTEFTCLPPLSSVDGCDSPTIVAYMPHCGRAMYNNLIWSLWSRRDIKRLIIIGNRIDGDMFPNDVQRLELDYLYRASRLATNYLLPIYSPLPDAFNDTAIVTFPSVSSDDDPDIWTKSDTAPVYSICEGEIL